MGKGFFISKTLGIVGIVVGIAAVATIIALSVVYAQEKQKSNNAAPTPSQLPQTGPPSTPSTAPEAWASYRLPHTLMPDHYEVILQPFLNHTVGGLYIFRGNSTVRFQCVTATNLIVIHSKKLNYTMQDNFHVSLEGLGGVKAPPIKDTHLQENKEYLIVQLDGNLQKEAFYEMSAQFEGELADDLAGFYRSEYEDGQRRVVATTQMQAADARKAFPCFDEPAMKATFSVVLIHPSDHVALSNMLVKDSRQEIMDDGAVWNRTEFETTLKMSTYLLAFIVSQFESVDEFQNDTLIRIWGRPNAINEGHGDYALNVTGRILRFFEDHYDTPYPLNKSDQVALPDFNAGAMENWGLVTYRETALLLDPQFSAIGNKERVLTVIAHELAHQWFGNLVTLRWWNDLWLNEGFASYVEYLGAHAAEPTWKIKDLMVPNEVYRVMAIDALVSSHPLSFPEDEINTPAQISEVFDAIAYSKGASVLRMLSEFLTETRFKRGLKLYLQSFAYNNTVYTDLWNNLQKVVDEDNFLLPERIQKIMDTWILQMGFPVLTVDTSTGNVTQQHFLLDPRANVTRPSEFNYTWIVPVTWMTSSNQNDTYWLTVSTDINTAFKTAATPDEWLLLNLDVVGYFRVNYDQENWDRLLAQLNRNHTRIQVVNRAQLIDDAFNLARAKHINTTLALSTTLYLANETEYIPWDVATSNLGYFRLMFDRSKVYGPMRRYIQKQVKPLFNHFEIVTGNWNTIPESPMDQYSEILAISVACSYDIPECLELAKKLFNTWRSNPNNNMIPPNLRSSVYCTAIRTGSEDDWNFVWEMFQNTTVVAEKDKLRSALACSQEPWILQRYLGYTLDPSKIRRQDATSTINSIARNVIGQTLVWNFVRANWRTLFKQYGGGSFSFSGLIQTMTERFASEFELKELKDFQRDNADVGFGSGTRALEQALERTQANIKWVSENQEVVLQWFESHS